MLKDANPSSFAAKYVVCRFTDMRYGIDTLAAIIESRYHLPLFVPGTLFKYCINQEKFLRVFLSNEDVPMDNNLAERSIRPFTLGRKNWVNIFSEQGLKPVLLSTVSWRLQRLTTYASTITLNTPWISW